jgi:WhiB family transcriptional regulator, redox-sensing transcriptional regulator
MITVRNWRLDAACRTSDPDLFFPIGATGPAIAQIAEARQVCQECPVRTACLNWALRHDQGYGIWGGTTEEERRALRPTPASRQAERARMSELPCQQQRPRYLHRQWQADVS